MTQQKIKKIVEKFRDGMLGNNQSDWMCFTVCYPLKGYLSFFNIETELISGYILDNEGDEVFHVWLKMKDGIIIDPTADQFFTPNREPMPKVYIGELPEWYYE